MLKKLMYLCLIGIVGFGLLFTVGCRDNDPDQQGAEVGPPECVTYSSPFTSAAELNDANAAEIMAGALGMLKLRGNPPLFPAGAAGEDLGVNTVADMLMKQQPLLDVLQTCGQALYNGFDSAGAGAKTTQSGVTIYPLPSLGICSDDSGGYIHIDWQFGRDVITVVLNNYCLTSSLWFHGNLTIRGFLTGTTFAGGLSFEPYDDVADHFETTGGSTPATIDHFMVYSAFNHPPQFLEGTAFVTADMIMSGSAAQGLSLDLTLTTDFDNYEQAGAGNGPGGQNPMRAWLGCPDTPGFPLAGSKVLSLVYNQTPVAGTTSNGPTLPKYNSKLKAGLTFKGFSAGDFNGTQRQDDSSDPVFLFDGGLSFDLASTVREMTFTPTAAKQTIQVVDVTGGVTFTNFAFKYSHLI